MPPYVFERLEETHIRLINLLPPSSAFELRIQLKHVSIDAEGLSYPNYEALSYTWGGQAAMCEIEVVSDSVANTVSTQISSRSGNPRPSLRSDSRSITLMITENVKSALVHLREQHASRTLWIDSICLNQRDDDEKNREIPKMSKIYAKARRVLLWLGVSSFGTNEAFRAIGELALRVRYVPDQNGWETVPTHKKSWKYLKNRSKNKQWENITKEDFEVPFKRETWLAIQRLLSSECFRRVWIWQEICLAVAYAPGSVVLRCGMHQMSWQAFLNAVGFFYAESDISGGRGFQEQFSAALKPVANIAILPTERNLLDLLISTRRCGCTNPKDRVYGVLGLANRTGQLERKLLDRVKPRSNKSCDDVYKDFAIGELLIMRRLNILWNCDANTRTSNTTLPSWAPYWHKNLPYSSLNLGIFGGGQGDGAVSIDTETNVLSMKGVICDRIERECSDAAYDSTTGKQSTKQQMISIIHVWCRKIFGTGRLSEKYLVALCHVLTSGYVGDRYPSDYRAVDLEDTKATIDTVLQRSVPELDDNAAIFVHMLDAFPGRRLFITDRGRIGLGPTESRPGDQVVSIIGSKQLMLLRPVPNASLNRFRIVGICYVHGLMNLEAILGQLPEDYSVRLETPCSDSWDMRFVRKGLPSPRDPRLPDSHDGWDSSKLDEHGSIIWDRIGGEVLVKSDPRHTDVSFLRSRKVFVVDVEIV